MQLYSTALQRLARRALEATRVPLSPLLLQDAKDLRDKMKRAGSGRFVEGYLHTGVARKLIDRPLVALLGQLLLTVASDIMPAAASAQSASSIALLLPLIS